MREKPLILAVDDDKSFRDVLVLKLKVSGFDVVEARDGNDAIAKAKKFLPDLALLDIRMPGGPSGVEVALALREMPETQNIKLLFLSGSDDPWPAFAGTKEEVSKELGALDFVEKTTEPSKLIEKIKGILQK
ncbi:MAG: response regulator [Patescibacteria group bacterium]